MSVDIEEVLFLLVGVVGLVVITASAVYLFDSLASQQRHAFILKCMAELGNNNAELCSSIAK